jgi:hypothetical protein
LLEHGKLQGWNGGGDLQKNAREEAAKETKTAAKIEKERLKKMKGFV